jgi:hypothetical protein
MPATAASQTRTGAALERMGSPDGIGQSRLGEPPVPPSLSCQKGDPRRPQNESIGSSGFMHSSDAE